MTERVMQEVNEITVSFPECMLMQPLWGVFAYISTNIYNSGWDKSRWLHLGC